MQAQRRGQVRARWLALATLLLAALAALAWLLPSTTVTMRVQGAGEYQVYFDPGDGFSEANSTAFHVEDQVLKHVTLKGLPVGLRALRIDPPSRPGYVRVCAVAWQVELVPGLRYPALAGAAAISPGHQARSGGAAASDCDRWIVEAGATDPQLDAGFPSSLKTEGVARSLRILALILLVAASLCLVIAVRLLPGGSEDWLEAASGAAYAWIDRKLVVIFLVLGATLGAGYAFLTPPGASPDEVSHAGKVARISIGDWVGADEPGPFPPVTAWYGSQSDGLNLPRTSAADLQALSSRPLACARTSASNPDAASNAGPFQYLAPSLAYQGTCASNGSFGMFLYGSRVLNLALYLGLVAWGLRHAGFGRWPLAAVALLPMPLYLAASISYDAPMLAATFCLLGFVSGVYSGRLDCRRALLPIVAVSLFLALQKPQAGWVFVLPAIALWRCRAQGYPVMKWAALTMLLPLTVHLAWVVISLSNTGVRPDVAAVNGAASLVDDPLRFLSILADTYSSPTALFLAKGLVGILGWLDVYLSRLGYAACLVALAIAFLLGGRGSGPTWPTRIFAAGAAFGAFIVSNVPFYAFWTPPEAGVIQGLQGRYFLSMFAVLLMVGPTGVRGWWRPLGALLCLLLLVVASLVAYQAQLMRYF